MSFWPSPSRSTTSGDDPRFQPGTVFAQTGSVDTAPAGPANPATGRPRARTLTARVNSRGARNGSPSEDFGGSGGGIGRQPGGLKSRPLMPPAGTRFGPRS